MSGLPFNLPQGILEEIFSYISVHDLRRCEKVCRKWRHFISDGQANFWLKRFENMGKQQFRISPLLRDLPSYRAKVEAFVCAWNPDDKSPNIYIKEDALTLHRNPVAQSTDAIRGKVGFTSGVHYWVVVFQGPQFGSTAVVGVSTKQASLHKDNYSVLLGSDEHGWGWDLPKGDLWSAGKKINKYPANNKIKPVIKKHIGCILDMDKGTLEFEFDSVYLGVAFTDLPTDQPLYPTISAVYGNSEISLIYMGKPIVG